MFFRELIIRILTAFVYCSETTIMRQIFQFNSSFGQKVIKTRSITSSSNVSTLHPCKLYSCADTNVMGSNCVILNYTGKKVTSAHIKMTMSRFPMFPLCMPLPLGNHRIQGRFIFYSLINLYG